MSVLDMATLTLGKVKEYTSSTLVKLTRGISGAEFIKRCRRIFWVSLCIWLAANTAGFLVYRTAVNRMSDVFYSEGVRAALEMAMVSRTAVLDKDVLTLNLVVVRSVEKTQGLILAAIVDHQGQLLARVGSEESVRQLQPFEGKGFQTTREGVAISDTFAVSGDPFVLFSIPITYSDIDIGKAIVALSAAGLWQDLNRAKWAFGTLILALGGLLIGFVLWSDRRKRKKAEALMRHAESVETLGPYHLISKVAQGGMAELYLADYLRQDGFRRRVALKRILPHFAAHEEFIGMFIREARLAALLQHPNIVQVFDYGRISDISFIAMEYIDGRNLGEIMSRAGAGLAVEPAVFIFSEICKGLEYSHSKIDDQTGKPLSIVHRDISPQNILVSFQGEVKLSDFGISKARTEPNITQVGVVKGKLMYLAPEQLTGKGVDHRVDLYALGLVFYQALTGDFAYRFDSEVSAIRNIPTATVEPLRHKKPGIPEELDRIVIKCLEKSVETRYQSAAAINADLTAFKRNQKISFDSTDLAALLRGIFDPAGRP
ncbi:MAG: serine/threonine-protein kinase [Desulfobacterales bacterium]